MFGLAAWGSSHEARYGGVRDFTRVDSRFARGNTLRDIRLKGKGRLGWRPLSFRTLPVGPTRAIGDVRSRAAVIFAAGPTDR